ncbi:DUF4262 domain-containing protein [Burkholderia sp. AU30280]|uniref:DUF4262 domain-containing protein n=1 Tax=Burkholderia sp. AU30280 TaxID=2879628 RepID=UPI001CF4960B|nr:DUF4262 domain-containing protein [Burkholderia sp. AU30280]MCA8277395.1 DUF4262 domain-containing protein [Burkholderia sp. AU30280]
MRRCGRTRAAGSSAKRRTRKARSSKRYRRGIEKTHYEAHLGWNRWFYGNDDFPCVQLLWPDRNGIFPWQPEADDALNAAQPRLYVSGDGRQRSPRRIARHAKLGVDSRRQRMTLVPGSVSRRHDA